MLPGLGGRFLFRRQPVVDLVPSPAQVRQLQGGSGVTGGLFAVGQLGFFRRRFGGVNLRAQAGLEAFPFGGLLFQAGLDLLQFGGALLVLLL